VLEQNLRQSRDEARLANKVKQEFLANMSHELRTPLNGILGLTRLLSSGPNATDDERECFTLLQESGESLQTHLDDILTYTALESGKLTLRATEFDLPVLVEELFVRARSLASRKGLECDALTEGKIPERIQGDRQELQRSVMALVHNAIKFTTKGSIRIAMSWADDKRWLRVNVRDSGPGIPREIEQKIYEPFVQLDTSASRRHSGLGLGLALASKVVTIGGGSIRCLNPGEPGAVFELLFPLQFSEPVAAGIPESAPLGEGRSDPDFRILAVDDNDLNRRVLRLILAKAGIASDEAASGEEALQVLSDRQFDLIFMDVQMPGMDGLEATRRIRADFPKGKQPFIIALTAHALPSDRQLCLEAGMDEYLSKPVEAARLLRWIDRLRKLPPGLREKLSATRRGELQNDSKMP
jgi:two-component system, sensor histidine kinase